METNSYQASPEERDAKTVVVKFSRLFSALADSDRNSIDRVLSEFHQHSPLNRNDSIGASGGLLRRALLDTRGCDEAAFSR